MQQKSWKAPNTLTRDLPCPLCTWSNINYGFSVMVSNESPNVPFTILRTRFQQAPETIIYDNRCNLHEYALKRNPVHIKKSTFLVDRLHWRDHTGCSSAYDSSSYREMDTVNTQVAEQRNSVLQRIESALSYMNQENFMHHCKFFLWYRNKKNLIIEGLLQ